MSSADLAMDVPCESPAGAAGLLALCTRPQAQFRPDASSAPATRDTEELGDVRRSVDGDGEAYARLVRRHQAAIGTYMWRFTRQRGQWEELVHDVFVEAYLSLRTFRGRAPLAHWLRRIATRVGYHHWKRRAKLRTHPVVPLEPWDQVVAGEPTDPRAAAEQVHAVLQRLAPRDRLVLTLMYLEECSVAQIAELTGWTQSLVKVQAYRARSRLKKLLEPES